MSNIATEPARETAPAGPRKNPDPTLLDDLTRLHARCETYLQDLVAIERAKAPGVPPAVHRNLLLRGSKDVMCGVKQILLQRKQEAA